MVAVGVPVAWAPTSPATAAPGAAAQRLAGSDRYDTSARIALATFSAANTAVLASGENFPDGLAAAGLAGAYGAPVLLTPSSQLSSYTTNALASLGVHSVIVVGGTNAVSSTVSSQLSALGYAVTRVAGTDRYDTAAKVASAMTSAAPVGLFNGQRTAFLATGATFPDALGAGAPAYALHIPILLTASAALSSAASAEITALGVTQVVILGGTNAVSAGVASAVGALPGVTTMRVSGTDRYDTAAKLASLEWASVLPGPSFDFAAIQSGLPTAARGFVELASGLTFADAESVGPRAGMLGAPILLDQNPLPPPTDAWLSNNQANVSMVEAIGGSAAVADTDLSSALAAVTSSGGSATISALAGETAFSISLPATVDTNTVVASAFTVNNARADTLGVSCAMAESYVCTGLPTVLKSGDLITLVPGAITTTSGQAVTAAPFTVAAPTAPTVATTQFIVGGTDFNVTFSRPVAAATLNSTTVTLSGGQTVSIVKDNSSGGLVPSATPVPTSFTFHVSGAPIALNERLTLAAGITDDSAPPLATTTATVIAATPDNVAPTPQTVTTQPVSQLSSDATVTVGGITVTARSGTQVAGANGNNFWVRVVTSGVDEATTVAANSNCSATAAGSYCLTINTGGLTGPALTGALAADSTFSSSFVGTVTGAVSAAGPTRMSGGATAIAVALVLNKPIDPNSAVGLGSYALDVNGDGNTANATFTGLIITPDNAAAPGVLAIVFTLSAAAPQLTGSTKLDVLHAPVGFSGLALTPASIAVP